MPSTFGMAFLEVVLPIAPPLALWIWCDQERYGAPFSELEQEQFWNVSVVTVKFVIVAEFILVGNISLSLRRASE
ncbi:hypothetical protein [Planctomicrobium piriforme]|uniref:Uncharacterized protein n=1 Tax=Planctomicrobium piriforme TaxID=1576369 RepID=A0A1I3KAC3_9PLAN|nr:hypothetical protein [Planctomicrobium piriforme]SFI69429.1 hypothetical protein SAMN05421753_111167 [Planctomicrobium piriforme]